MFIFPSNVLLQLIDVDIEHSHSATAYVLEENFPVGGSTGCTSTVNLTKSRNESSIFFGLENTHSMMQSNSSSILVRTREQ